MAISRAKFIFNKMANFNVQPVTFMTNLVPALQSNSFDHVVDKDYA